jgi:lipopolysaccharide transport system ATP-binding protein
MSDSVIRIQHLSKRYLIGRKKAVYPTLRDSIAHAARAPFRRLGKLVRGQAATEDLCETLWALRDVSLDIHRGEIVGLIGGNGAGKSTLLKILSRITEPSSGRAEIRGRVGSLLEVGTGFHPELTGRENTYLNGAMLGMHRAEIARKFDEIVAFAEIERFIDTPVKHYSSGMYTRLAFAVAAHLEPEILLVDEVLAVGDVRFQKKCLNKMQDVRRCGRTVIFVSHNAFAITQLCQRAILLQEGKVMMDDTADKVVNSYLASSSETVASRDWPDLAEAPGGDVVRLRAVRVKTKEGQTAETTDIRQPVGIEMEYDVLKPGFAISTFYYIYNEHSVHLLTTANRHPAWHKVPRPAGRYKSTSWIPGNFFAEGTMSVRVGACVTDDLAPDQFDVPDVVAFHVVDPVEGDSVRGDNTGPWGGVVRPMLEWTTEYCPIEAGTLEALGQEVDR